MPCLYRSMLYVPANNVRAVEKVRALPCDAIIFDLEDAVAPADKDSARAALLQALSLDYGHRELLVRVNALASVWGENDLRALAPSKVGIVLPKVNSATDIVKAEKILPNTTDIWAMLETPRAILNAGEIAASSAQLKGMIMGLNDLAKDLRVAQTPDRAALLYSLSACVVAARAYGRSIIDAVYGNVKDEVGFAAACAQGRCLGFDGKSLIHPSQIIPANQAFAPSVAEVEQAKKIINAWDSAPHGGVITLESDMIEALHVEAARQTLALQAEIKKREGIS